MDLSDQPSRGLRARIPLLLGGPLGPWLAGLAGAALPLAFAPVGWAWLAVVAPALLFAVIGAAPGRRGLWAGYAFGLGYYGVGISWIYVSIGRYGDSGPVLAVLFTALFVAFMAVFTWLTVYLARRLATGAGYLSVGLALPLAWVSVEWLRTWFLTGFPWLLVGYSQTDTPLRSLAPAIGVLGVSLLLALIAGALAWWLLRPEPRRALAVVAALALALGASVLLDRDWTRSAGEPLDVVLLQGNIPQDKKWSPDYLQLTLDRYRELSEAHLGADLIIWPESAIPAWFHDMADGYLAELTAAGAARGSEFVIGVPYFDEQSYLAYNSVVSLGREPGVYHKRHLVPFGEYLPLRDVFGKALDILGAPMSDFAAGTAAQPLMAAGQPLGVSVCYEVVYGPSVAEMLPASRVLVNVSNDAWFGDSLAPHQHLQMARWRALETGRPMLRATNTGITALIDHHGRLLDQAPQFQVAVLAGQVEPRQGATPYVRWLDYPVLGLLALGVGGLLVLRRRRSA